MIKAYANLEKLVGNKNAIELPSAADPFASPLWEKMGAPADATGYKIERPDMPDGMTYDENLEAKVFETAAGVKMLPQQVQALVKTFADYQSEQTQQLRDALDENNKQVTNALKSDWGSEYDGKVALARQAAAHFGLVGEDGATVLDALEGQQGGVQVLKFMAELGSSLSEDVLKGGASGGGFGQTPEDAKAEYEALKLDANFMKALGNRNDPGHTAAVQKREALLKKAFG